MKKFQIIGLCAALGSMWFVAGSVSATDFGWTNTAGGTFSDAGNWDPNGTPGTADLRTGRQYVCGRFHSQRRDVQLAADGIGPEDDFRPSGQHVPG